MELKPMDDIEKTAAFLYQMNRQPEYHSGYIARNQASIVQQLKRLNNKDMYVLTSNDEIIAAVGLDIQDKTCAHVFGPVTARTDMETLGQIDIMWNKLLETHPAIEQYEFYIHADHHFGQAVMKALKTQYLGTKYKMVIHTLQSDEMDTRQVIPYQPIYKKSFTALMKNLYVNYQIRIEEIMHSLGRTHELFILMSEGMVKGYIWLAVNDNDKCYIDYVATHKNYRQQGIGHQLVAYAVEHAFEKHHATAVQLTVEDKRRKTIEFYEKIGFEKKSELHHFKYVK